MMNGRRLSRTITTGVAAVALLGSGVATASATVAPRNASGCNGNICITVNGPASAYQVSGYTKTGRWYGHFQYFAGGSSSNAANRRHTEGEAPTDWWHHSSPPGTLVCVRAWEEGPDGKFYDFGGYPCETVS